MIQEELEAYIAQGMSQRDIARVSGKSQTTIRYWLMRFDLSTDHVRHNRKPFEGKYVERHCKHHDVTTFIYEPSKNGYRCKKCRSGRVNDERRALKRRLVAEAGGECIYCGYHKSPWSMHFHHRNANGKSRDIGHLIRDRKYPAAKAEITKCDLVCANCHGELEEQKWQNKATAV